MNKRKAIMELLIVTFNKKDSAPALKLIKNYTQLSLIFQSFGSIENNDLIWNFDIIEQNSIIAIIPINKTNEILSQLEASLNLKTKHQGIAFTVPLNSATQFMAEKIRKGDNKKWKHQ